MARLFLLAGSLIAVADFNGDGKPDYLLYNASYPPNSDLVYEQQRSCGGTMVRLFQRAGAWWPLRILTGMAHPDYLLFNPAQGQTAIWYINNNVRICRRYGPTASTGWSVVGVADFDSNGQPDYLLPIRTLADNDMVPEQ